MHRTKPFKEHHPLSGRNPLPTFDPTGTFAILAELTGQPYPAFLADVLRRGLHRLGLIHLTSC